MGRTHKKGLSFIIKKEDIPARRNMIAVDAFLNRKAGAHRNKSQKREKDKLRREMNDSWE